MVNTNTTFRAIANESTSLQRALELLPGTLRKANTTFVNLRATLDDLEQLVDVSKPATRELEPFFRRLRPLVADARPTIADLRNLIRQPGANNDLIELTSKQPKLARLTASVFPRAIRALDRSQPVVEYARYYTPDLAGWFTKFGQVAGYYDANGHYARVMPVFSPAQRNADNTAHGAAAHRAPRRATSAASCATARAARCSPRPTARRRAPVPGCDTSDTPPGP